MSGGFGTDAELMQKASGQVEEVRGNVENAVHQLQGNMEPLLASWQGGASQVFRRLMDQFKENADTINRKLGEIGESIKSSGQTYTQQEEEHAQEMSKIEGMLGG
jgi:WXG100 family type VII secretion target